MNVIGLSLKNEDFTKGAPLRKTILMRTAHPARVFVVGAQGPRFETWAEQYKSEIDVLRFDDFLAQLAKLQSTVTAQRQNNAGLLMMQMMMMAVGSTQVMRNFFSLAAKKINTNIETFSSKTVVLQVPPLQCHRIQTGVKAFQGNLKVEIYFMRLPTMEDFENVWIL